MKQILILKNNKSNHSEEINKSTQFTISERNKTHKLIKELRIFQSFSSQKSRGHQQHRVNLDKFHTDTLLNNGKKTPFHCVNIPKYITNFNISCNNNNKNILNDKFDKKFHLNLTGSNFLSTNTSSNKFNTFYNNTYYSSDRKNYSTINSNNSTFLNSKNKSFKNNKYMYKICYCEPFHTENLSKFNSNVKKFGQIKFIHHLIENEIHYIKEKRLIEIDQANLDIFNYNNLIKYIVPFNTVVDNYFEYLDKKVILETGVNNKLKEKKIFLMNQNFLLKNTFAKIKRIFESYLSDKFFILCVKNHSNQIEKFKEEDKEDLMYDKKLLINLFDMNKIQKKLDNSLFNSPSNSKTHSRVNSDLTSSLTLNNEELVMRPQKILFNSPDDFLKNLNKISLNINQSIFEYNIKDKEVTDIRKKLNEKLDEKQNYEETLKLYNDEINNLELKFKEMKIKYDSLFTYKKNLIILIQTSKESNLFLCEKKIFDIYKRIMSNSHILKKIKKKFNEKINTIMYLREIEKCINLLLKWEKNQIKHNFVTYSKIKKEIEKEKRLEIYQILKAKEKEKFELKLKKIIEKNNKLIIKPFKKVGIKYKID